jgi:hypothetical protein
MAHSSKPPVGSGFDPTNFQVRRYVITSYSDKQVNNVVVQKGIYKVFNKY